MVNFWRLCRNRRGNVCMLKHKIQPHPYISMCKCFIVSFGLFTINWSRILGVLECDAVWVDHGPWILEGKGNMSFRKVGLTYTVMQCHVPLDWCPDILLLAFLLFFWIKTLHAHKLFFMCPSILLLLSTTYCHLTRCRRVTQICVFNTVKLGTSASSP